MQMAGLENKILTTKMKTQELEDKRKEVALKIEEIRETRLKKQELIMARRAELEERKKQLEEV